MLRLKATEIALAPADVEETRQRMQRRQTANLRPAFVAPARTRGQPHLPPHGPRIRRGAQRSRDTAIVDLGNIPILRPQEATPESGDDADDDQEVYLDASNADSESAGEETSTPTPSLPADPSPTHNHVHLPFRPAPRTAVSEDTIFKTQLSQSRFGRERTNSEDDHEATSQARIHASTDGLVEPVDTVETPMRHQAHLRRHSNHVPSPLQQMHTISSPRQPPGLTPTNGDQVDRHPNGDRSAVTTIRGGHASVPNSEADEDDSPTLFLEGFYDRNSRYTFREALPQTEPRPRTQPAYRARTMSSTSEPSHSTHVQRPDRSGSSVDDVFWNSPAPEIPSRVASGLSDNHDWPPMGSDGASHLSAGRDTIQRNGSEASSSTHSLAYSFYELPDSRHSSSTYSYSDLEIPQYDGATASRLGSRGAYHSIRLPQQHRESSGTFLHPPPQSRAISPLPTNPYTRDVSGQHFLRPSPPPMSLFTADNLLGPEQDAVEAVGRNLSSPLDLVEERATSYFHRLSAQFQANQQQTHGMQQPIHPQHGFQQRQALQRQLALRQRHALQQAFHQQQQSDAYMIPARRSRMPGSGPGPGNPRYQQPLRVDNQYAAHRRDVPATRNGQRSSENVPVSSFTNIPALPARFSMPQPPRPRDMSNRPRIHSPRQDLAPPASFFPRAPSRGPPSTSTTLDLVSGVTSRRPTGYPAIARLESRNDG